MDFYQRLYGSFIGKNIGGTLGMPYEGSETRNQITFYHPVPAEPAANDDLDLQLVWLKAFEENGLELTAEILGEYWLKYIDVHWDEYGTALRNLKDGLKPPLSGIHNNNFAEAMGASIRSDIWAALFAGAPASAAYYAYMDASVDHGGDGIYTEVFFAVVQALLLGGAGLDEALAQGRAALPETSRFRQAVDAIDGAIRAGENYDGVLDLIMAEFGSINFTDAVMNNAITYAALRCGEGDFVKTILLAVNAGQDADCTAATAGACIGALIGIDAIPEAWKAVVGDAIVVGSYIKDDSTPKTISELCRRIQAQRERIAGKLFPTLALPVRLPEVVDFSERRCYRVNGRDIEFDGIRLAHEKYDTEVGKMIRFSTVITPQSEDEVILMVASRTLFVVEVDGKRAAVKGDQSRPVPGVHRVRGGRIIPFRGHPGSSYRVDIDLYPTMPIADLYVGCYDWNNRQIKATYRYPQP